MSIRCATVPHVTVTTLPDLTILDSDDLKALVIQQHAIILENQALVFEKNATLESQHDEIERLKLFIAKLQRMQFGPSSERLAHHIDQLELGLEDLETQCSRKTRAVRPPTGFRIPTDTWAATCGAAT